MLSSASYVCDPRPDYPLVITAKRYWISELSSDDPSALTLVLAHGTGYHKEQWEPTIEYLYEYISNDASQTVKVKDVWSIDAPNHGDAAVLNEATLRWGYDIFDWAEYSRAIHIFLAGLGTGVDVDFSKRNLVGIGHSMGAVAHILCNTFYPKMPFKSFILVEPMCFPQEPAGMTRDFGVFLTNSALKRRDIFPSREDALAWLKSRAGFKVWDERVLQAFVDHGMRDLPTAEYPDKKDGVTLKCTRAMEVACYVQHTNTGRVRGYNYLPYLCSTYPVHFLYGAVDDYIPAAVKEHTLSYGTQGKHASVKQVPNAGHVVVQTHPCELASAIWATLSSDPVPQWEKCKL